MEITSLAIADVRIFTPRKFEDGRGFFSEVYNRKRLAEAGIDLEFVQDNHSLSEARGTIRGLHFQRPPFAQDKLVRVVAGRIFDVAVDLRQGSPSFGKWVGAELSSKAWNQIFVPVGFAHGFCTLEPNTEVVYKVTNYYAPEHDSGVRWDDSDLAIDWPIGPGEAMISDKDRTLPTWLETDSPFVF